MNAITSTTSPLVNSIPEDIQRPYLQLQLGANITAAISMKHTQEVFTVASRRITPMPNMPDCILGLLNQRSRVFWVADLSQILGIQPIERNLQQYYVAIIRVKDRALGLIIPKIEGVTRLSLEDMQPPEENAAPVLVPYLQGCHLQPEKTILVLNAEAILNSPRLHSRSKSAIGEGLSTEMNSVGVEHGRETRPFPPTRRGA